MFPKCFSPSGPLSSSQLNKETVSAKVIGDVIVYKSCVLEQKIQDKTQNSQLKSQYILNP
jgi:hypothetical protein